jgi:hypothetical protein
VSHITFRDRLVELAGSTSADPAGFLEGLSDIHDDWHREVNRTYGFLLFHSRVVRYFRLIVGSGVQPPIEPFTAAEFRSMNVQPFDPDLSGVDTLGELARLSTTIESWHNTAHSAIGMATGVPMMDPRQNIFFRPFWQLHFFIEGIFETVLDQYGDRAHPGQFVTPSAVTSHIEAAHHGWVTRI